MPFKIYRSSAGSGKTFTLVKEYLRIALGSTGDTAYRGILAITFTNKAAEEMKARVLNTLRELADPAIPDGPMANLLREELGIGTEDLRKKSERVLRSMLHNYADIGISTIDSFTHRVIRTFAQDFGLPVNFEVEMDTDRLITAMTDRLLAQVGVDKGVTDALIDLSLSQAEDEKSWSIDQVLTDMAKTIFNEEGRFHLAGMKDVGMSDLIAIRRKLVGLVRADEAQAQATANDILQQIAAAGLEVGHFSGGKNGMAGYLEKIVNGKLEKPNATVLKNLEADIWYASKAKAHEKSAIDALIPAMMDAYGSILSRLERIIRLGLIVRNIYGIALLDRMAEIVRDLQQEQEVLHIGEFNHLVSSVVMKEQAPFIYERLGHRYHHFLVDEFQDTNVLQWFNMLPLIDESLATDGLCLVVGDAKQSIYRWRGGEVQQFVELPSLHRTEYMRGHLEADPQLDVTLTQRERSLVTHVQEHALRHNFRTRPTIVDFNNRLFAAMQDDMPEPLRVMYDGVSQLTPDGKTGGRVEVRFLPIPEGKQAYPEYLPDTLEQVLEWVEECIADGYAPGDIAIICRSNQKGIATAQFLIESGHSVVSSESLLINSSPYVRLLVNLAVFIIAPHDTTNQAELVQHLCMARDETRLVSSRLAMVGAEKDRGLKVLLKELYPDLRPSRLRQLPLFSLFEAMRHHLLGHVRQPHLIYFMDEVLEYARKEGNDLNGFLIYWAEHRAKRSIALTENRDAIRILTVHKSKGLEFPVVIHPFADYDLDTSRNSIWLEVNDPEAQPLNRLYVKATKELEDTDHEPALERERELTTMDMFNMLYVALTRPQERLYISGRVKADEATADKPTDSAAGFLYRTLPKLGHVIEENRLAIGERDAPGPRKEEKRQHLELRETGGPDWMSRIAIARPSQREWGDSTARDFGILVHDALAHVRTAADVSLAVQRLVEDGRIPESGADGLRQRIHSIIDRPELERLFSDSVTIRTEADIQMPGGQWLRPDRVVTTPDMTYVLDYKTGGKRPEHQTQIAAYRDALTALGHTKVHGLLVYMEDGEVIGA
jgi:ATP-dependent exoDNAse (exonuclease V) beta subunit